MYTIACKKAYITNCCEVVAIMMELNYQDILDIWFRYWDCNTSAGL